MRALIAVLLLVLVSACASYNYPVYDAGDGVYYAASPPTYTIVDPYPGFSYYSPYFYPYYFSVWYSPWYRHHYGWYRPSHRWCPPYRMPHAAHYAGVSPDMGHLPGNMNPGPSGPYPNPPGVVPGLQVNHPELWQAKHVSGSEPGTAAAVGAFLSIHASGAGNVNLQQAAFRRPGASIKSAGQYHRCNPVCPFHLRLAQQKRFHAFPRAPRPIVRRAFSRPSQRRRMTTAERCIALNISKL